MSHPWPASPRRERRTVRLNRGSGASWRGAAVTLLPLLLLGTCAAEAGGTNTLADLPDSSNALQALFRMIGALALVLAVFAGGVWFYRNWQRMLIRKGGAPKLRIQESRSLGGRHAIHVVGYEGQRLLIGSSPGGITFLTHLADGEASAIPEREDKEATPSSCGQPSFAGTLQRMMPQRSR